MRRIRPVPVIKTRDFSGWLKRSAAEKRRHFEAAYAGKGIDFSGLEFKKAILQDMVGEARASALQNTKPAKRASVKSMFEGRDSLSEMLRKGRGADRGGTTINGWRSAWDRPLAAIRNYYGRDIMDFLHEAAGSSGKKRALFLGAGTGREAADFAHEAGAGFRVEATALARLPQHKGFAQKNPNLRFRICHFGNMVKNLGRGGYAMVVSHGAADRLGNPVPIFTAARQLLAKGGIALLDAQRDIPRTELGKWSQAIPIESRDGTYRYVLKK